MSLPRALPGLVSVGRALVAGLTLAAIVAQLVDLVAHGVFRPVTFFSYFTIQSALIGSGVLLVGTTRWSRRGASAFDVVRGGAVLYLLVTACVFAVVLSGAAGDQTLPWVNVVLHQILPAAMVLDWLILPPVQHLGPRHALLWLSYPLAWAAYTLVRGGLAGQYPYPFLDPAVAGVVLVGLDVVAILIGTLVLAGVVIVVGNLARARRSGQPSMR